MGILDDAIKEHLELKRQHGAGESELQQLEGEAFGAAERPGDEESAPDPLAEAPTEFMQQPDAPPAETPAAESSPEDEPVLEAEETPGPAEEVPSKRAPRAEIADLQEAPPSSEPEPPTGPSTAEREAIAEQPTEMYDVEEELAASQPEAPSEEELVEEEMDEPRLAPVDPLAALDDEGAIEISEVDEDDDEEEADDFFDEKRLSDELDQALEAPGEVEEPEDDPEAEYEDEPEGEVESEDEPETDEQPPARHDDEDVLEETPDFLEEAPEDDQLWFEQKPPKDFDFDD